MRGGAVITGNNEAAIIFVSATTDGNGPLYLEIDAACSDALGIDIRQELSGHEGLRVLGSDTHSAGLPRIQLDFAGRTYSPWAVEHATLNAD